MRIDAKICGLNILTVLGFIRLRTATDKSNGSAGDAKGRKQKEEGRARAQSFLPDPGSSWPETRAEKGRNYQNTLVPFQLNLSTLSAIPDAPLFADDSSNHCVTN